MPQDYYLKRHSKNQHKGGKPMHDEFTDIQSKFNDAVALGKTGRAERIAVIWLQRLKAAKARPSPPSQSPASPLPLAPDLVAA